MTKQQTGMNPRYVILERQLKGVCRVNELAFDLVMDAFLAGEALKPDWNEFPRLAKKRQIDAVLRVNELAGDMLLERQITEEEDWENLPEWRKKGWPCPGGPNCG